MEIVALTRRSGDRVRDLLEDRGTFGAGRGRSNPGHAPAVLVQCLSAEAAAGDPLGAVCYPAARLNLDALAAVPALAEPLWLTVLSNDRTPTPPVRNGVYLAVLAGYATVTANGQTVERRRAFAVATGTGNRPPITEITAECDDEGGLIITTLSD